MPFYLHMPTTLFRVSHPLHIGQVFHVHGVPGRRNVFSCHKPSQFNQYVGHLPEVGLSFEWRLFSSTHWRMRTMIDRGFTCAAICM
jgi:hypothetical protein